MDSTVSCAAALDDRQPLDFLRERRLRLGGSVFPLAHANVADRHGIRPGLPGINNGLSSDLGHDHFHFRLSSAASTSRRLISGRTAATIPTVPEDLTSDASVG